MHTFAKRALNVGAYGARELYESCLPDRTALESYCLYRASICTAMAAGCAPACGLCRAKAIISSASCARACSTCFIVSQTCSIVGKGLLHSR